MTRIVGPTGSKRRKRFLLLPLLCTAALALFWISGAQAVHDLTSNYFELGPGPTADEGGLTNILGYDSGGVSTGTEPNGYGPDWANLFNADGSKYTAGGDTTKADCEEYGTTNILDYGSTPSPGKECAFISDPSSAGSLLDNTTFSGFGTSNKNTDPISGPTTTTGTDCQVRGLTATQCTPWGWDFGNIPAKDDLTHTYAYEVVPQTGPRAGDVILYGGLERESPSGDSYVDFEFFQGPVALCGTPAVSPATHQPCTSFTGVRTPGDVIVSINFLKGGAIGDMQIRKFDGTINNYPSTPNSDAVGGGCFKADGTSGDDVCAFNNADTIGAGAWGAFDNHAGSITQLPANAFTEIGVDLTTVLGESPCISTFMAKTRSSASFTSELKDFAGPTTFSRCQPSTALTKTIAKVNTTAQPAGTRSVTAHVGDSITYAYTETNDGQDDLSQPNTTGGPTSTTDNGGWVTDNTCSPVLQVVGDGSTTANSLHNIGDLNNDNKLNVGEAWKFSCTLSNIQLPSTGNTITNVAIGHGKDPLIKISSTNTNPVDVTYCTSGPGTGGIGNNGLGQFCDLDERDSNTVTIIAPSTSLTKTAQVTVVYTFKETNTGNDPISSVAVTDAYASGHNTGLTGCTVAPVLGADLTHNVGDLNNNDKLDPASGGTAAETWTFRCTVTSTDGANVDVWDTGTGSGNDSTGTAVPSTNESDGVKTLVSHCSGPCS